MAESFNTGVWGGVNWAAVVKSDTVNQVPPHPRALYVGTTGDVALVDYADNVVTFKAVPAGVILPLQFKRVNSTNTGAADMVAIY